MDSECGKCFDFWWGVVLIQTRVDCFLDSVINNCPNDQWDEPTTKCDFRTTLEWSSFKALVFANIPFNYNTNRVYKCLTILINLPVTTNYNAMHSHQFHYLYFLVYSQSNAKSLSFNFLSGSAPQSVGPRKASVDPVEDDSHMCSAGTMYFNDTVPRFTLHIHI